MANEDKLYDLTKTRIRDFHPDHMVASFRTWLNVGDVMSSDVITISPERTTTSAAKIMAENNISCIIVVDNKSVVGILTETDILNRAVVKKKDFDKIRVADIMSSPVESISPDLSILEASRIMGAKQIKRLPILAERGLVGIVTQTDLIRALTSYGMWRDVAEIMNRDVAGIQRKEAVADAAKIMASRNISCVIALEADQVVGVLTERDLLEKVVALKKNPICIKVEQVMSSPAISIPPSCSVFSASRIMEKMDIRRLVVMEDKRLYGIVTQTDIFRAVKKKLQAEEEKSFRLLENSKSNIYIIDLEGKTTYVNPSFMKLLDVSDPEGLINQPFLPERFWLRPERRARFLKRLLGGGIETMELALKTSKGRRVYVTLFSAFAKNVHGEISGNQGILYDITAKKELVTLREAEEALRESEERYRRITGAVTDYIFTVSFENGHPVETTHSNSSISVTGYSPEEFTADPCLWIKMVHPEDRDAVHEQASKCIPEQDIAPLEHRIVHKDGAIRWLKSTLVPYFDLQGNLLSYDGLLQDITERKETQEILDRKQKNLEAIFDAAPVGMLLVDENMIAKRVNKVIKQMVCKDYSQIINQRVGNSIGCIDSTFNEKGCGYSPVCAGCPLQKTIKRALDLEKPLQGVEFQATLKVGDKEISPWLCISAEPVIVDGSRHVVVAINDVTKRKQAEEELQENIKELERFNRLAVGRELRMIELKKEINAMLAKLGREPQYESVLEGEKVGLSSDISEKEV